MECVLKFGSKGGDNMNADDLLMDIVKCGINCRSENSPCHNIWTAQGCKSLMDFQLPEPWNGDIENARLLFLGVNPCMSDCELFPKLGNDWWVIKTRGKGVAEDVSLRKDRIVDYFKNRFSSKEKYVIHEHGSKFQIRLENGGYLRVKGNSYWPYLHKVARIILGDNVEPGRDYALTEVVHCKTHNENGLFDRTRSCSCYEVCKEKWLRQIFEVAYRLEYVVVLGNSAISKVAKLFSVPSLEKYKWHPVEMYGRIFKVLFVYHSNGLGRKNVISVFESFQKVLDANKKEKIGVDVLPDDLKKGMIKKQGKRLGKDHTESIWNLHSGNQNELRQKNEIEEIVEALKEQGVPILRVDGQYIRIERRDGIWVSVGVLRRGSCLKLHASVDGNRELWEAIHSRKPAPMDFKFDEGPNEGRGSVIESRVFVGGNITLAAKQIKERYCVLRKWLGITGFFK